MLDDFVWVFCVSLNLKQTNGVGVSQNNMHRRRLENILNEKGKRKGIILMI